MNSQDRYNARLNIAGEAVWGFQTGLVGSATVLTVLLLEFGASQRMIGSLAAIEGGLIVLPQIVGVYLFHSHRRRKRDLMVWHFLAMIPFWFLIGLLIARSSHFSPTFVRWGLLALYGLSVGTMGIIMSVWLDWLAHLFPVKIRGTVMGRAFFASGFAAAAGAFLAGRLLAHHPGHGSFAALYFAAGTFAIFSIVCFCFVRDPATDWDEDPPLLLSQVFRRFRESLANPNFRAFLIGRFLASVGFCILPFVAVYFKSKEGGLLANNLIVQCGAVMALTAAIGNLLLGRLGDRRGHRIGIIIGVTAQMGALLVLLVGSGVWSCIAAYGFAGFAMSAGFISQMNMLFETCPHDHRVAHITVGNLALAIPVTLAPILGGQIAETWGLRPLFGICLFFNVLAAAWIVLRVREPRALAGYTTPET